MKRIIKWHRFESCWPYQPWRVILFLKSISRGIWSILKLIWEHRELYRQIICDIRDHAVILIAIVLMIWFFLNGISETQENYRLNHLEYGMNSYDKTIQETLIKNETLQMPLHKKN